MSQAENLPQVQNMGVVASLDTDAGLNVLQRQAKLFANSFLVPPFYRVGGEIRENGRNIKVNENQAVANCSIALSMAMRLGVDPMAVFQNMFIVKGKPSFSASFMVGLFNKTGQYSPITYKFSGQKGTDDFGCYAVCKRREDDELVEGPLVTIGLAKKEGWYGKPDSKWQTMPDLMLRYRAAAFLIRTVMPEVCLGLLTQEEATDIAQDEIRATAQVQRQQQPRPTVQQRNPPALDAAPAQLPPAQPVQQSQPRQQEQRAQQVPTQQAPAPQPTPQQPMQTEEEDSFLCPTTGDIVTADQCTGKECQIKCLNWQDEV